MVKNLLAMQETQVQSLGQGDPIEKGIATHSSILTWRIPWTEKPQSMGLQKVRHDEHTQTHKLYSQILKVHCLLPILFLELRDINFKAQNLHAEKRQC